MTEYRAKGRRPLAAVVWLLMLLGIGGWGAHRLMTTASVDTSILALLPADDAHPLSSQAAGAMSQAASNQVVFLVGGSSGEVSHLQGQAEQFRHALSGESIFESVWLAPDSDLLKLLRDGYRPYRYQLLTTSDRERLKGGDAGNLARRAVQELVGPVAGERAVPLADDPLNLLGHWLSARAPGGGFRQDQHGFFIERGGQHYRVVLARFEGAPFEADTQRQVIEAVETAAGGLERATLHRSGVVFHAAAGAKQARHELSTIGLGSLTVVVLLLLWHFRSAWSLALPVLSVGAGLCVAVAACLLVFGRIHVVTLAFGASLVGVSVDYAMHYLCARRALGRIPLRAILPGIALGLSSSVLAYGAQAMTPFPGLQQIAVFSASGLAGAWLTVVLGFPLAGLRGLGIAGARPLGLWLEWLGQRGRRPVAASLAMVAALALYGVGKLEFRDNLGDLQSSPATLQASERLVQSASGGPGASRFLLVSGRDVQEVLRREESLHPVLSQMEANGRLGSWQAVSRWVPSVERQRADYQLVRETLLETDLTQRMASYLGFSDSLPGAVSGRVMDHDVTWITSLADVEAVERSVPFLSWLWLAEPQGGGAASVIALGTVSNPAVYGELDDLAQAHDGVRFVDRVANISELLGQYRYQVGLWLAVAYGLVGLVLLCRYRGRCWQILLPPVLATGITFGLLSLVGQSLTLFNLLASLLILGIGLDMGIFLRESNGQIHAWEAVTLSAATSVLAFGLLALSGTPVLHHFGVTILPGLVLCWLIVFVVFPPGPRSGRDTVNETMTKDRRDIH